jgi:hypothetical protein
MLSLTAQKAIEAYGGVELWRSAKFIEAEVSVKGLAFTLKRRPFFEHAKLRMEIDKPYSILTPIGKKKGISGILDGQDVRLENAQNEIVVGRKNARQYFPFGRRLLWWDDLDMAYFANYAFWNYFTLPRLLMNKEIEWTEKSEGFLIARFPKSIPTHNEIQEFHCDKETGRLIQHNYTAEIISGLAKAANVVLEQSENDNSLFTSLRRVTPRTKKGKPLNKPVLIEIKVHNYSLINENE